MDELKRQKPDIKILVLGVFPRGGGGDAEFDLVELQFSCQREEDVATDPFAKTAYVFRP